MFCVLCTPCVALAQPTRSQPEVAAIAGEASSAGTAATASDDAYQALIADAVRAFRAGALIEARDLFTRAHALSANARTLRGLGVVAFELRQYRRAIEYLDQSLSSDIKPLDEGLRKSTEELLTQAQRRVGRFHLVLAPVSAELWLDGARAEQISGNELVLEQGEHRLELRQSGYASQTRTLEVRGREDAVLEIKLVRVAPAPEKRVDTAPVRKSWLKNPWLWSAVGVVVLGGATATGVVLATRDKGYDGGDTGKVVGAGR